MTDEQISDRLDFHVVRQGTPQWEVYYRAEDDESKGVQVARVTERFIKTPPYVVNLVRAGEDIAGGETEHEDRDTAFAAIVAHVRAEFGVSP